MLNYIWNNWIVRFIFILSHRLGRLHITHTMPMFRTNDDRGGIRPTWIRIVRGYLNRNNLYVYNETRKFCNLPFINLISASGKRTIRKQFHRKLRRLPTWYIIELTDKGSFLRS